MKPNDFVKLCNICDKIRKNISEKVDKVYDYRVMQRVIENQKLNDKRYIFQFFIGDWVMYSRKGTPQEGSKLDMVWIGPYQIVNVVGDNVYSIRSPLGKLREVHSSRLWFYSEADDFKLTDELITLFRDSVKFFDVKKVLDHKVEDGIFFVLIWWKGFPQSEATWEEMSDIYPAIPELMEDYIQQAKLTRKEKTIFNTVFNELTLNDEIDLEINKRKKKKVNNVSFLIMNEQKGKEDENDAVSNINNELLIQGKKYNKFHDICNNYKQKNENKLPNLTYKANNKRIGLGFSPLEIMD